MLASVDATCETCRNKTEKNKRRNDAGSHAEPCCPDGVRRRRNGRLAFMDKYFPDGDKTNNIYGYATAQTMAQVLKQCGDNLTRENVMKQAASLKDFTSDVLLPGIKINTSANDFFPIEQMQLMKFNGEAWEVFGDVITGEVGH
jgi:hypothetical protein